MNSAAAKTAARTATIEACRQTLREDDSDHSDKLVFLITDMMALATSIEAIAEQSTFVRDIDGVPSHIIEARRAEAIVRMAGWIHEIGERVLKDYDRPHATGPTVAAA